MREKFLTIGLILYLIAPAVRAQETSHTSMTGEDTVTADFFREWYHRTDLVYYLEALNDHTIAETTTYGQWWMAERLHIAVEGLPSTQNRYYLNGFRIDDVFQPGNTFYVPNMQQYNLVLNTHTAQFFFSHDPKANNYLQTTYNFGQIGNGEPAYGTTCIFNITHRSPMQSADTYQHISARRHQKGAGQIDAAYTFHDHQGNTYRQHIYSLYGQRLLTRENHSGLIPNEPYYKANYYKVQADGYLPIQPNPVCTQVGYLLNFAGRDDAGSEYLYNYNEVYNLKNYSASLYMKRQFLTTGVTWSTHTTRHDTLCFSKNILDQDGESLFPYVADGNTHTLSWAVNYLQPLLPWLNVKVDAMNSLLLFTPRETTFHNDVYLQQPNDRITQTTSQPTPLYRYEWESNKFTGGLLENTIGLEAHHTICPVLDLKAHLDLTLDAILLQNKNKVTPNWQAALNLDLHPCKWYEMGMTLAHQRMTYNTDYLRFFSNQYMNANIYYANTNTLYATTGGKYHHYQKGLKQPSYLELDIPIRFHFRKHEIVLQQSYKKFFHTWHTSYQDGIEANGEYQEEYRPNNESQKVSVYYPYAGEKTYEVGYAPTFGTGLIRNRPYYFSQLTRYTFTGKKVMLSLSWQSMQESGYSALGNGVNSNSLQVLSETTANPNTHSVVTNPNNPDAGVGRLNLDKGYVCRFYLGYNICQWVQAGITIKWTDGKPFTDYVYFTREENGHTTVSILPSTSRGTNPTDGDFGQRHCAKYNVDLHLQGKWMAKETPMQLTLECYNLWDFCHDLAEMSFVQDIPYADRASMIMDIPTGLLATLTIELK